MALTEYIIIPGEDYQDICDATRTQTGKTDKLKSGEVASEILSITKGGGSSEDMTAELIWTNPESTLAQSTTTITVDKEYDWYVFEHSSASDGKEIWLSGKGRTHIRHMVPGIDVLGTPDQIRTSMKIYMREINISSTQITISSAAYYAFGNKQEFVYNDEANTNKCVIYRIWGITL